MRSLLVCAYLGACALDAAPSLAGETRTTAPAAAPRKDVLSGKQHYSHGKEELIIRDFFKDRRGGFFLDVGCWHPIQDSNTYYLEEHLGWSGIGVDALPEMGRKWKRNRPASQFVNYLVTDHAGTVETFYRAAEYSDISAVEKPATAPGGDPVTAQEVKVPTLSLIHI